MGSDNACEWLNKGALVIGNSIGQDIGSISYDRCRNENIFSKSARQSVCNIGTYRVVTFFAVNLPPANFSKSFFFYCGVKLKCLFRGLVVVNGCLYCLYHGHWGIRLENISAVYFKMCPMRLFQIHPFGHVELE